MEWEAHAYVYDQGRQNSAASLSADGGKKANDLQDAPPNTWILMVLMKTMT